MIADLCGKGGRIRTVAIPIWVKLLMDTWTVAAGHSAGRLLRPVSKGGRVVGEELSDWAVWSVVEQSAKAIGIEKVSFDRSGFAFHGRVKALAEAAREHGLQF